MRLRIDPEALRQLGEIQDYVAQFNPKAARDLGGRLIDISRLLAESPFIGRQTRRRNVRKFPVSDTAYVIVYRIEEAEDRIVILAFLHGARQRRLD